MTVVYFWKYEAFRGLLLTRSTWAEVQYFAEAGRGLRFVPYVVALFITPARL